MLLELGFPKEKLQNEGLKLQVGLESSDLSMANIQAIQLVREIISNKKIVILDEVTSHFDNKNEEKFREVFLREFSKSTIIIISHRLETILRCDKVMVLDRGNLVEFDNTTTLLNNPSSALNTFSRG